MKNTPCRGAAVSASGKAGSMRGRSVSCRLFALLAGAVVLMVFAGLSEAQPVIEFEQEVHNFGEVMQGETVEHTFKFTNRGDEELVIEKVSPS